MSTPRLEYGEKIAEFFDRGMGDSYMVSEYPDVGQRFAVCRAQLRGRESKQTSVHADLKAKLLLEEELKKRLKPYHQELVRQFTRHVGLNGIVTTVKPEQEGQLKDTLLERYRTASIAGRSRSAGTRILRRLARTTVTAARG